MSNENILSLPKHKNPVDANGKLRPDRTASAPYNFVPLPEIVVRPIESADHLPDHDRYDRNRHTGYFEVTLTTKSPVYVRCPFTRDEFDLDEQGKDRNGGMVDNQTRYADRIKNKPDFFYTRDPNRPVIPGSSLRGMLRSVLEIASYGKVQWVTDKKLFFRTVGSDSLGDAYRNRMTEGTGTARDGYRSTTQGGFLRRGLRGVWQIETCDVARVRMDMVAEKFGQPTRRNLCSGNGPMDTPLWDFQHKQVWVQCEPNPTEHRSSGPYLRYREATSLETSFVANFEQGTLVVTGPMQSKKRAFVFIRQPNPQVIDVPNDPQEKDINKRLIDRFHDDDQITPWQERAFRQHQPVSGCRERDGYLRDGEPVFFLRENGQISFFGRAQMFRLPYRQNPLNLVPDELRRPCDIDYAESLFGFVRTPKDLEDMKTKGLLQHIPAQGDKKRAYAGRVFVTDAVTTETDVWLAGNPVITPKILATPKPTAFQQYLTQQEPNKSRELDHYDSPPPHHTVIRGHKRYWHQGLSPTEGLTLDQIRERIEDEKARRGELLATSTQHSQVKPVKPGVQFRFRVYFENLSDGELGAICWTLYPLGDTKKTYCHHLGMGKPLGMGAVKLEATLHLTNRSIRYGSLFHGNEWQLGLASSGEPLSDRDTLEKRTREFEQHVLGTLGLDKTCQHLFEVKRVAMLLKMMEWSGFRSEPAITGRPVPNNVVVTDANGTTRPNTRYMMIELPNVGGPQRNEYRERPVLPDPEAFGGLTGTAEPTGSATPSPVTEETVETGGHVLLKEQPRARATRDLRAGDRVLCVLLEEKTKKGGWKAKVKDGEGIGVILAEGVPSDLEPGQAVELIVQSTDPRNMSFRWPKGK